MTTLQKAISNMHKAMELYAQAQMLIDGASMLRIDATSGNPNRRQLVIWAERQERDAKHHEDGADFYNSEAQFHFDQHARLG